jgi:hypothetical protein
MRLPITLLVCLSVTSAWAETGRQLAPKSGTYRCKGERAFVGGETKVTTLDEFVAEVRKENGNLFIQLRGPSSKYHPAVFGGKARTVFKDEVTKLKVGYVSRYNWEKAVIADLWLLSAETRSLFLEQDENRDYDLWIGRIQISQGYEDHKDRTAMSIKGFFTNENGHTHWERVFNCAQE